MRPDAESRRARLDWARRGEVLPGPRSATARLGDVERREWTRLLQGRTIAGEHACLYTELAVGRGAAMERGALRRRAERRRRVWRRRRRDKARLASERARSERGT